MSAELPISRKDTPDPRGLEALVNELSAIDRPISDQRGLLLGDYLVFDGNFGIGYKFHPGKTSHRLVIHWDMQERLIIVGRERTRVYDPIPADPDRENDYANLGPNISAANEIFLGDNLHVTTTAAISPDGYGLLVQIRSANEVEIYQHSTNPNLSVKAVFQDILAKRNKPTPQAPGE